MGQITKSDNNPKTDRVHAELACSIDNEHWFRIDPGTPFISNGLNQNDYDWGCIYCANKPYYIDKNWWIYYGGSDGLHTGWRNGFLCLAKLKKDRFAGYSPLEADKKAMITTPILQNLSKNLNSITINTEIEPYGYVDIEVLNKKNKTIARAKRLNHGGIECKIPWESGNNNMDSHQIKLKFNFKNAKLYSFEMEKMNKI